jgi:dTDP-4-dehydrorhamnose reductase
MSSLRSHNRGMGGKTAEPPKILIVGARSKTAEAISRVLAMSDTIRAYYVSSSTSSAFAPPENGTVLTCDFTSRKDIKELCMSIQPDVIINTAAYTNVDAAELDKQKAWSVNVNGVENLVGICRLTDAHLIHFSTDYIFDGERGPYTETDKPNPLGYYGKTKMAGENVCVGGNIDYTIIRTNVLYGATKDHKPDFVTWVLNKLSEGKRFSVVNDQFSNPTLLDDLGYLVDKIVRNRTTGIFHAGGATWLSRYEFARSIATVFKESGDVIIPIPTSDLRQTAPRPMRGGLITLKTETTFGIKFSSVESGLLTMRRQLQVAGHHEWSL